MIDTSLPHTFMTTSITVRGLDYQVEPVIDSKHRGYVLKGKRGAEYMLLRTVKQPEYLWACNEGFKIAKPLQGVWFTDKDGELQTFRE
jgi:hypothetical protein